MILIAAGSNVPLDGIDSQQIVLHSFLAIDRFAKIVRRSPFYESPAWPDPAEPPYVNAVASLQTDLPPAALMAALHAVEQGFGRVRSARNAPRTLDLDLIAYNDVVCSALHGGPDLPHPRMQSRDFVLAPLVDIAPDWLLPGDGRTATELLRALPERSATPI